MDVGVQGRPKALDGRDRAPGAIGNPAPLGPAPLEAEHGAHEDAQHRAAQLMIPGERIAQPVRQRQHPLAHRQAAEHAVDQVRRQLGHPPAATRRTEATPLAGKGNEDLALAVGAPEPGKALRQDTAGEELAQFALNEARQPLAAPAQTRLGQERLKVLADHLVQYRVLGSPAHVGGPCAPEPVPTAQRVGV